MRRVREMKRPRVLLALATIAIGLAASPYEAAPREDPGASRSALREGPGVISIVPAKYSPNPNFHIFARSRGAGAAKGAAVSGGFAAAITVPAAVGAAGTIAVFPAAIMVAGLTSAMSVYGAISGSSKYVPKETADKIESVLDSSVTGMDAQNALARELTAITNREPRIQLVTPDPVGPDDASARPNYTAMKSTGVDTVLEVAVTEIGFQGCGPGFGGMVLDAGSDCGLPDRSARLIGLYMSARARLVRTSDGSELFVRQFSQGSPWRPIPDLIAADGQLLTAAISDVTRELATRIHDEALLVSSMKLPERSSLWKLSGPGNPLWGICGLAPIEPKSESYSIASALGRAFGSRFSMKKHKERTRDACLPGPVLKFTPVENLRPTLRWSAFPRDLDRQEVDGASLQKIADVTYDLRIWSADDCSIGRLVYERTDLPSPVHELEAPLEPASRYFWSVRAHFDIDGYPHATRWAYFDNLSCSADRGMSYLRFMTPQQTN